MLDMKLIRKDPHAIEAQLKTKDPSISLDSIIQLDEKIREVILEVETLQAEKNSLSKEIGEKKRQGIDTSSLMQKVSSFGDRITTLNQERALIEEKLQHSLMLLPNLPLPHVKVSLDPKDNVCIKSWGEKKPFTFPFKNHVELNEKLHLFDFKRGAKVAGSGWPAYKNLGARLEWALINYMLQIHFKNGLELWIPPLLARQEAMLGSAHLPKFESQLFKIKDEDYHLYLIPTAESALNGLHLEEIFLSEELPKRYVAYTPCFRREAGAAGSGERGLIRMHQFNKVEMFAFAMPEQSDAIFEQMVQGAEEILQGLNLHYRNMELVTGDMSFAAMKTWDIEVWLPGQNRYYEVSSISHCGDFQARRSLIRYRRKDDKPEFVHTLNGSGLATSRLMVALLENNQREDGSVEVPEVLRPYLNGVKELCPE
ncbi:serine--tRNA ligase [Rhabdochlamydiaceae symbiont of Dictyostelium giganteum]|uniref:serine--tRNA ligase n=1 Tax=Rhabdochlamydiaceae symbiont of Dictyostelium giganteum TaxID=3342349 RepID=UPI00384B94F6